MKALTLRHPWPWAILCMGKRIENRTWAPLPSQLRPGERFVIHGGKMPSGDHLVDVAQIATDLLSRFGVPAGVDDVCLADVIRTGIVAVVTYKGVVYRSDDPWFEGPKGWVIDEVDPVDPPFECRGSQGLWDAPADFVPPLRILNKS